MTERLYYTDCYLRTFDARVVEVAEDGRRVYLDRTAFYPTSGGQLFDVGTLAGVAVTEVIDEEERVAHVLAAPLPDSVVVGEVDWTRRYDFMQQHTGQHLLSAVLEELFGFKTVSVHMGEAGNTVDVQAASVTEDQLARAELRCAEVIAEARPISIGFEDASSITGLRKESSRTGTLRIVAIDGIDRSACGGTHVRTAAEIGLVLTGKTEKIRGITRIEFACGARALRRARADNQLLAVIGRTLSIAPEQVPERVAALVEQNKSIEKERQRLTTELARREGTELYLNTTPDAAGLRRFTQTGPMDDAVRVRAQAFVANQRAVFLAISQTPPAILLATSADSGIHAGERIKSVLAAVGGRGGGNQTLAQGSVPDTAALEKALQLLQ
jgi:alanyl-tRNA synthetase